MELQNKYMGGKIYKLISNETNQIYYGSTVQKCLTNRLALHRSAYERWLAGKTGYVTSFELVKFPDCKIVLVENFPCNTKYELTAREQVFIDKNECVNKRNSTYWFDKKRTRCYISKRKQR